MSTNSRVWSFTIHLRSRQLSPSSMSPKLLPCQVIPDRLAKSPLSWFRKDHLIFLKYSVERSQSGNLHLQGCLKVDQAMSMNQVKSLLQSQSAHVEPAIDWPALKRYVAKEETHVSGPFIFGEDTSQGAREDIKAPCRLIAAGASTRELALQHSAAFVKYHRGFAALKAALTPARAIKREVYCIIGDTEAGKSRFIFRHFPFAYRMACIVHPWADGYDEEETAVLEECGRGMMGFNMLKNLLDCYPLKLPVKGGFVAWNPKRIFLTSNTEVAGWWCPFPDADLLAILRRMQIFHFPQDEQKLFQILFPTPAAQADLGGPLPDSPMDPLPIPDEIFELEFLGDQ